MTEYKENNVCSDSRNCKNCPEYQNCCLDRIEQDEDIFDIETEKKSIEIQDEILKDHFEGHLD